MCGSDAWQGLLARMGGTLAPEGSRVGVDDVDYGEIFALPVNTGNCCVHPVEHL